MSRDDIFNLEKIDEDFVFNDQVAEVFDDMLDRSIPYYRLIIDMTARLLEQYLQPGDRVYDLGCSTGTTLLALAARLKAPALQYVGVDSSSAMIRKAVGKAENSSRAGGVRFVEKDIMELDVENVGAIILNYTLQFIRPLQREKFLRQIYGFLRPGGVLIMSEKVICGDSRLNREFIEVYYQYKKERGYSDLEIARKREALENVLIPFTGRENENILRHAGFGNIERFFQWFNFVSFVAVKQD
jgi:tRNA (cmo5U34)-methyltransferase